MSQLPSATLTQQFQAQMQSLLAEIDAIPMPSPTIPTTEAEAELWDRRRLYAALCLDRLQHKRAALADQWIQTLVQQRHEENRRAAAPFNDYDLLLHLSWQLTGGTVATTTQKTLVARFKAHKGAAAELGLLPPGGTP
jgi:hypothetical protein